MATNDFLEAERRERPRVAVAAGIAALLTLGGWIIPRIALGGSRPDNGLSVLMLFNEHRTSLIAGTLLSMAGLAAVVYVLDFLARAAANRNSIPPLIRPLLLIVGAVVIVASTVLVFVSTGRQHTWAVDSSLTFEEARAVSRLGIGIYPVLIAQFAFTITMGFVAVSAMRAGLLSRFLGILGGISAVLFTFPLLDIPIVQAYWLLMLALTLWSVGGAREPPAWQSGEAIPWPSSAELREQRVRAAEEARGERGEIDAVVVEDDENAVAAGESAGQRRKRKKRR
ncbi:hypothetical protein Q5424_20000 [Conexibacter sp. JD483]|uniref:hypothetical protein n=1 Tax=unclassified Conexibacter TaxID=2627773 RepID=UPI002715A97A|nr:MULTISPECIES: hypothetical protein [unclassified Conexibacter]MDO8187390.1 hypothetical protein [Conexibacter sp. CPCC 205706]MDO8200985.1 hypothetical protein [Conexibacter sp. CPCC 205762]MDR9371393.1 hypothetical protein [Conexibacter sp. JD483]